jgi:hypothetical protein
VNFKAHQTLAVTIDLPVQQKSLSQSPVAATVLDDTQAPGEKVAGELNHVYCVTPSWLQLKSWQDLSIWMYEGKLHNM